MRKYDVDNIIIFDKTKLDIIKNIKRYKGGIEWRWHKKSYIR